MDIPPAVSRLTARLAGNAKQLFELLRAESLLSDDHILALDEYIRSSPAASLSAEQLLQFLLGDLLARYYHLDPAKTSEVLDLFTLRRNKH